MSLSLSLSLSLIKAQLPLTGLTNPVPHNS
jgi:hypothetical protein